MNDDLFLLCCSRTRESTILTNGRSQLDGTRLGWRRIVLSPRTKLLVESPSDVDHL